MAEHMECCVSFRIKGDSLDPQEITELLQVEPDTAHKKGDSNSRISNKGKLIEYSPFSSGLWAIDSKMDRTVPLEKHIMSILVMLQSSKVRLTELFSRGYEMDVFCGVFIRSCPQPGFDICSSVLQSLGELNISFGLCIYCT